MVLRSPFPGHGWQTLLRREERESERGNEDGGWREDVEMNVG